MDPTPAPVREGQRIESLDVLRGVALLGILVINIQAFAHVSASYGNPTVAGGFVGLNFVTWLAGHVLFEAKMMALFSLLFGAGVVLMTRRAEARGSALGIYYRRTGWLLLIGLIHAYGLWYGDILVAYALCGLVLYPLRNLRARWLMLLGIIALGALVPIYTGVGLMLDWVQRNEPATWSDMMQDSSHEAIEEEGRIYADGTLGEQLANRALLSFGMQTVLFALYTGWRSIGMMLIGMALMRIGLLHGTRSRRFYACMALVGYGIGLPIVAIGAYLKIETDFDPVREFLVNGHFNNIGSVFVTAGHLGLILWWLGGDLFTGLRRRLAAVGRMALTNYIGHSVVCTAIFYSWGLGLFGKVPRVDLVAVVIAVWVLQLWASPLWLARYRFGPLEWAWRTLTYMKRQPLRR